VDAIKEARVVQLILHKNREIKKIIIATHNFDV
jgi:hypothetical protein